MKCVCAQTRPRFILSSERVFGGMEFEPMLTPREKSPLPENVPRGGSNPRRCGQRAQALPTELFRPPHSCLNRLVPEIYQHAGKLSKRQTTAVRLDCGRREFGAQAGLVDTLPRRLASVARLVGPVSVFCDLLR